MRKRRDFDEEDVRTRPTRSTKPRSKERPQFENAVSARVITVDRGRVTCVDDQGRQFLAVVARELGRRSVVVGDLVGVVGITEQVGVREDLARIVKVDERRNSLRRSADDGSERILVANIDCLAIVSASTNPDPKHGFVNRALVAAFTEGISPILVMTKSDLGDCHAFVDAYKGLELPIFRVQKDRHPSDLSHFLTGKITVLIGHSGVGKSTLLNNLIPHAVRETGTVNEFTGKGRHTSSSAYAMALPSGGWVIDTPGVRSFGLSHVKKDDVVSAFPDCAEIVRSCPKNCSHDEDSCALKPWASADPTRTLRLRALQQILSSL